MVFEKEALAITATAFAVGYGYLTYRVVKRNKLKIMELENQYEQLYGSPPPAELKNRCYIRTFFGTVLLPKDYIELLSKEIEKYKTEHISQ